MELPHNMDKQIHQESGVVHSHNHLPVFSKPDTQVKLSLFPRGKAFLKYRIKLCCHGGIKAGVLYRCISQ